MTKILDLGCVSYLEGREKQEQFVRNKEETLIFCEHFPVISLGKNAKELDLKFPENYFDKKGVEVVKTDRGGGITFHGPGQLMIYPVMRVRGKGVKKFIEEMLEKIVSCFEGEAEVVVLDDGVLINGKKVVFCGLRILNGISNHGFAINIDCDLEFFSMIVPCRDESLRVGNLKEEGVVFNREKFEGQV